MARGFAVLLLVTLYGEVASNRQEFQKRIHRADTALIRFLLRKEGRLDRELDETGGASSLVER